MRVRGADRRVEEAEMQVKGWSSCRGRRCSGIERDCACKENSYPGKKDEHPGRKKQKKNTRKDTPGNQDFPECLFDLFLLQPNRKSRIAQRMELLCSSLGGEKAIDKESYRLKGKALG